MSLTECVEKHTHRQYLAWMEYLKQQWNVQTPIIYYLMQIAQEIRQSRFGRNKIIYLKDLLIPFIFTKKVELTPEEEKKAKVAKSKSSWFSALGMHKKKD